MIDVLLTVDTEFWPSHPPGDPSDFCQAVRRDVIGTTPSGDYGLPFQLRMLHDHDLKAVFLVESLCALAAGQGILKDIIAQIQAGGQDVQLHLHPEWLDWMPDPLLRGRGRQHMHQFTLEEQTKLLASGIAILTSAGAAPIAFRAGNYGANLETLAALARLGMTYDTSYNAGYLQNTCLINTSSLLVQPAQLEDVWEYPITHFRDFLGKRRHLQIVACSKDEMRDAFYQARDRNWSSIVVVLHSFELINRKTCRPDPIVVSRFDWLCRFLAERRHEFRTTTFSAIAPPTEEKQFSTAPLRGKVLSTTKRLAEQLRRRL